jgi:hypothetical protein
MMRAARAYIAGTGATAALVAAVTIVLLSLAALVTFEGLPEDSSGPEDGSVFVGPGGTAQGAAAALAAAPGAVAAAPVPVDPGLAPGGGPGADGAPGVAGPGGDEAAPPDAPGVPPPPEGGGGGTVPPPGTSQGVPVGGLVDDVDETAGGLGVDLGLGEATDPITAPVDQAVEDNLPRVTGAAGG